MSLAVRRPTNNGTRIAELVQRLRGAYNLPAPLSEEVVGWFEVLRDLDEDDTEAAWNLVTGNPPERCPTAFALRERILAITRSRISEEASEARYGRAAKATPPSPAARSLARISAVGPRVLHAMLRHDLPSDHTEVLVLSDEQIAAAIGMDLEEYRRRVAAHIDTLAEPPECEMCEDIRNVSARDGSVSPCPRCRPEQDRLWRAGHFRAFHSCPECTGTIRP